MRRQELSGKFVRSCAGTSHRATRTSRSPYSGSGSASRARVTSAGKTAVQDGDQPPEGPRRTFARQQQLPTPQISVSAQAFRTKTRPRCGAEAALARVPGGAHLWLRDPRTRNPWSAGLGRRVWGSCGRLLFAGGRQTPYGNHWVRVPLVQPSAADLCPLISP